MRVRSAAILCAILSLSVVLVRLAGADEARSTRVTAAFSPTSMGRFTFEQDGGLAFEPNLRLAPGGSLAYLRLVGTRLALGGVVAYAHTMAEYGGDYLEPGDGGDLRGYADLLRALVEAALVWGPAAEEVDFAAGLGVGPAFAWFDDLELAGFDVAARIGATIWLFDRVGLHLCARLSFDYLWARSASGWAADELEDARAHTLLLSLDLGVSVAAGRRER